MNHMKYRNSLAILLLSLLVSVSAFGQLDLARKTTSITYPLNTSVKVQFRGTTRFPRMKGEASIKRTSRNGTEISLSVSKMPRPFELGAGYATYVLWAISPTGQIDNLGEIKRRGFFEFDSKISVTTKLQTFALIITAEPHFLVSRPSQEIMLENLNPYTSSGARVETTTAVSYFGNSSDFFRDSRTPEIAEVDYSKTPSTILQARQAIALAKYAGAERDAPEELKAANDLLTSAENEWQAGRAESAVDISARQAISAAVKAESTAAIRGDAREKRDLQARSDAEIRQAETKFMDAQGEIDELRRELERERRNRELAERDAANYAEQVKELQGQLGKAREDLGKSKVEIDNVQTRLTALETQRQENERQDKLAELEAEEAAFMQSLRRFGTVAKNERGIVITIPENWWANTRTANFAPIANTRLQQLAERLNENQAYKLEIESHTDDSGDAAELQTLTQQRSESIAERLTSFGVSSGRISSKGMAAAIPVAPNTTNANRARNRRVYVILQPAF